MRWPVGLDWSTPYNITFRSGRYLESQAGSFGFQYLLFLPLSILLLLRRRSYLAAAALGIGLSYALLTCLYITYLRYLYPVLPLFMIVIAWVAAELRTREIRLYRLLQVLAVMMIFLNGYFIPAAGLAHRDLYLNLFDQGEVSRYIEAEAPQRPLVEHLNKQVPGAKVAFLTDGPQIAPLEAAAVGGSWHFPNFPKGFGAPDRRRISTSSWKNSRSSISWRPQRIIPYTSSSGGAFVPTGIHCPGGLFWRLLSSPTRSQAQAAHH